MSDKGDALDAAAPLPYKRRCPDYTQEEVEFKYDKEYVSNTKEISEAADGTKTTVLKETTETRSTKVYLYVYRMSDKEDGEHFMEAFARMRKVLASEWTRASSAQQNDASTLFSAMNCLLEGAALQAWDASVRQAQKEQQLTTLCWKVFKCAMGIFICTKVFEPGVYTRETTYLRERTKPMYVEPTQWLARLEVLSLFLPYLLKDVDEVKSNFGQSCGWASWWTEGELTEADLRYIVINKAPPQWRDQMDVNDVKRDYMTQPASMIADYFQRIRNKEKTARKQRQTTKKKERNDRHDRSNRRESADYHKHRDRGSDSRRYNNDRRHNYNQDRRDSRRNDGQRYERNRNQQHERSRDHGRQRDHDHRRSSDRGGRKEESHYNGDEQFLIDTWNDAFNTQSSHGSQSESSHSDAYYESSASEQSSSSGDEDRRGRR